VVTHFHCCDGCVILFVNSTAVIKNKNKLFLSYIDEEGWEGDILQGTSLAIEKLHMKTRGSSIEGMGLD